MDVLNGKRFRLAAALVAGASVVAFWSAVLAERTLRQQWGNVLMSSHRPPLLNGFLLRLDRFVDPAVMPGSADRYLAFVLSDACRFSAEDLPRWAALIRTLPFQSSDEILLITIFGHQGVDELARVAALRSIRTRRIDVVQRAGFSQQTGVSWTPATLLLDGDMRVRLVSQRVTDVVERLIRDAFDGA
jgi:hypothetical protein